MKKSNSAAVKTAEAVKTAAVILPSLEKLEERHEAIKKAALPLMPQFANIAEAAAADILKDASFGGDVKAAAEAAADNCMKAGYSADDAAAICKYLTAQAVSIKKAAEADARQAAALEKAAAENVASMAAEAARKAAQAAEAAKKAAAEAAARKAEADEKAAAEAAAQAAENASHFFKFLPIHAAMLAGTKVTMQERIANLYARNAAGKMFSFIPKKADFAVADNYAAFIRRADALAAALASYVNAETESRAACHEAVKNALNEALRVFAAEVKPQDAAQYFGSNGEARRMEASCLNIRKNKDAAESRAAYLVTIKGNMPRMIYDYLYRKINNITVSAADVSADTKKRQAALAKAAAEKAAEEKRQAEAAAAEEKRKAEAEAVAQAAEKAAAEAVKAAAEAVKAAA